MSPPTAAKVTAETGIPSLSSSVRIMLSGSEPGAEVAIVLPLRSATLSILPRTKSACGRPGQWQPAILTSAPRMAATMPSPAPPSMLSTSPAIRALSASAPSFNCTVSILSPRLAAKSCCIGIITKPASLLRLMTPWRQTAGACAGAAVGRPSAAAMRIKRAKLRCMAARRRRGRLQIKAVAGQGKPATRPHGTSPDVPEMFLLALVASATVAARRGAAMVQRVTTVAFEGIEARAVDVQVQVAPGLPAFNIVGLPDKAVSEARERVRAALIASGLALPARRITVHLAPADL